MKSISIIIPAYNEENVIESTVKSYLDFFKKKKTDFEILIIPNNCSDKTPEIAENLSKKFNEIKTKNIPYKVGKGGAVLEGFKLAKKDLLCYVDADNSTKPEMIWKMLNEMKDYDCVMGSRWLKDSKILTKQPLSRRIVSRGFNLLVRLILNLDFTDTQNGGKIFKKETINEIINEIDDSSWAFDVGLLYLIKKNKGKIKEIPIEWTDSGKSSLKMHKAIPQMFMKILKLRLK
ncbi:glycosyltransferase [Candidatus Woesearchaeota archaeon]|nr:glycosyltransferase [Candidatus Woesearchaeota archaeon]